MTNENKWFDCQKEKPPHHTLVLMFCNDGDVCTGVYDKNNGIYYFCDLERTIYAPTDRVVTHWMFLPLPPFETLRGECDA